MTSASATDLITAAATTIGAVAGIFAAVFSGAYVFAARRNFRWQYEREDPIADVMRVDRGEDPVHGKYLAVFITFRNRSPEPVMLLDLEILRPKGASLARQADLAPGYNPGFPGPSRPQLGRISYSNAFGPVGEPTSTSWFVAYVFPPAGWFSGELRILLRAASRSRANRVFKIVVTHARAELMPALTDPTASSSD